MANVTAVRKRITDIHGALADTTRVHKKISIMLDSWVQRNFKSEGGSVGGWAPITRQGRILQDTGRLRLSFLPFADKDNAGIGSDLDYSEKHEKGIGVSRRRMLPKINEVNDQIVKRYNIHVEGSIK